MAQKVIYEVEEIEKVVNFMKTEKNITNITENAGIYTIYSDSLILLKDIENIYLKAGQIITINGIDYSVLSVNLNQKTFTITKDVELFHMTTDVVPVKVLDATKWKLTVNYLYGTRNEINSRLKSIAQGSDKLATRFPLIWQFVNNDQKINSSQQTDIKTECKFAIVNSTDKNYLAPQRKELNFKPIIDPLLLLFKKTLESCYFNKVFFFENRKNDEYDKWYRYFYGSSDKNENVLDCPTDAIEISLNVEFLKQYN